MSKIVETGNTFPGRRIVYGINTFSCEAANKEYGRSVLRRVLSKFNEEEIIEVFKDFFLLACQEEASKYKHRDSVHDEHALKALDDLEGALNRQEGYKSRAIKKLSKWLINIFWQIPDKVVVEELKDCYSYQKVKKDKPILIDVKTEVISNIARSWNPTNISLPGDDKTKTSMEALAFLLTALNPLLVDLTHDKSSNTPYLKLKQKAIGRMVSGKEVKAIFSIFRGRIQQKSLPEENVWFHKGEAGEGSDGLSEEEAEAHVEFILDYIRPFELKDYPGNEKIIELLKIIGTARIRQDPTLMLKDLGISI